MSLIFGNVSHDCRPSHPKRMQRLITKILTVNRVHLLNECHLSIRHSHSSGVNTAVTISLVDMIIGQMYN